MVRSPQGIRYVYNEAFNDPALFINYDPYSDPKAFKKSIKHPQVDRYNYIGSYILSISDYGVLARHAERNLFLQYNYYKYLAKMCNDNNDLDGVNNNLKLSIRIRDIIAKHNLRLVMSIVKNFPLKKKTYAEWVSDGNLWMIKAIDTFDVGFGFKFSTYLSRALKLNSYRNNRELHISTQITNELSIVDNYDIIEYFEQEDLAKKLHKVIESSLNDRERNMLMRNFGLHNCDEEVLRVIGLRYGVTKERVRQIIAVAIEKLRQSLTTNVE